MSKRRPSFKGCCAMCALNRGHMVRGLGWQHRLKPSHQRKFGRARRIGRHEIPADQRPVRVG